MKKIICLLIFIPYLAFSQHEDEAEIVHPAETRCQIEDIIFETWLYKNTKTEEIKLAVYGKKAGPEGAIVYEDIF